MYVSTPTADAVESISVQSRPRIPIGCVVIAILLSVFGLGLVSGGIFRFYQALSAQLPAFSEWHRYVHLIGVGIAAVTASVGLLMPRRWGWWATIVFSFVSFTTFVLLSAYHRGINDQPFELIIKFVVCVTVWSHLHRKDVLNYHELRVAPPWHRETAVLLITVLLVSAIGIW